MILAEAVAPYQQGKPGLVHSPGFLPADERKTLGNGPSNTVTYQGIVQNKQVVNQKNDPDTGREGIRGSSSRMTVTSADRAFFSFLLHPLWVSRGGPVAQGSG